jgi:hypothetical protein
LKEEIGKFRSLADGQEDELVIEWVQNQTLRSKSGGRTQELDRVAGRDV